MGSHRLIGRHGKLGGGFRGRLRGNPADRDRYLQTKRELAQRTWRHVQRYADAKTAVIQEIMDRAAPG